MTKSPSGRRKVISVRTTTISQSLRPSTHALGEAMEDVAAGCFPWLAQSTFLEHPEPAFLQPHNGLGLSTPATFQENPVD